MTTLTYSELTRVLDYNPLTGLFTWKVNEGKKRKGKIAGNINKVSNYVQIRINKILYYAHILAWFYVTKHWPINQIDHKDNIRNNNVFENLQEATQNQNKKKTILKSTNTLGYKGVGFDSRRNLYFSKIVSNRVTYWLGYFDCPKSAAEAYDEKAQILHGKFAKTNKELGFL